MTEEVWYKLLPDGDANPVKVSFQSRVIDLKTAIKEDNGALNVAWMRVKTCLDGEVSEQPLLASTVIKDIEGISKNSEANPLLVELVDAAATSVVPSSIRAQVPLSKLLIEKVYNDVKQNMSEMEADQLVESVFNEVQKFVNLSRATGTGLCKLRRLAESVIKSKTAQALQKQHNLVMDGVLHYSGGEQVSFYKFINVETGGVLVGKVYSKDDEHKARQLFTQSKDFGCPYIVEYSGDTITQIQHDIGVAQCILLMPSFDYSLKALLDGLHGETPPAHTITGVVKALLAAGLAFQQRGQVHGDIKPSNIMFKAGSFCLIDYSGTQCGQNLEYVSQQYNLDTQFAPCSTANDAVCAASTIAEMVRVWPISRTGPGTAAGLAEKLTSKQEDEIESVRCAVVVALRLLRARNFQTGDEGTT